ncbi:MAG: META domain-containing protein [Amaricoccus sp.]
MKLGRGAAILGLGALASLVSANGWADEAIPAASPLPPARAATPAAADAAALGSLPSTFSGDLPCPDCSGIHAALNLWPDRVFSLYRRRLDGHGTPQDAIGRWSFDAKRQVLLLWDGEEKTEFAVEPPDRLVLLAADGTRQAAGATLTGTPGITPLDLRLPIRGMVSFLADRARITECLTGRDFPLAPEQDFATLEAAYLAAGVAQGKPLMASFEGGITERPKARGSGAETVVLVNRFNGVWPEETCEQAMSNTSLANTYWKVVRLGKTDIKAGVGGREPHLVLHEGEGRFSATIGCNQLSGSFTRTGDRLAFGPAASTRMACPPPLDAWEQMLGKSLAATTSWRVNGQALELLDATGMQIALFQSVALP